MVSFINIGDTKGRAFQFGEGKPLLLLLDQFHWFVFIYTLAQSLRMAFFSAIVKEVFIPYNMLEKNHLPSWRCLLLFTKHWKLCLSLCFAESTLSALTGGLPSYFSACCRVGVNAYVVLMSFSWKLTSQFQSETYYPMEQNHQIAIASQVCQY